MGRVSKRETETGRRRDRREKKRRINFRVYTCIRNFKLTKPQNELQTHI